MNAKFKNLNQQIQKFKFPTEFKNLKKLSQIPVSQPLFDNPRCCRSLFLSLSHNPFSSSIVLYWKIISNDCKLRPTHTHTHSHCFHPPPGSFKTHLLHLFFFVRCSFAREQPEFMFVELESDNRHQKILQEIYFSAWQVNE